jgi:hypothetical protein
MQVTFKSIGIIRSEQGGFKSGDHVCLLLYLIKYIIYYSRKRLVNQCIHLILSWCNLYNCFKYGMDIYNDKALYFKQ